MRYLHISRTIHQLVTDRNRVVGLYLAVPSLLYTASWAVLNAKPGVQLIAPMCASAHPSRRACRLVERLAAQNGTH
jgi:hypothetical protein